MATTAVQFPTDPSTWQFDQKGTSYYSHGLRERFRIDGLKASVKPEALKSYADIGYDVDEAKYRQRVKERLRSEDLPVNVPGGWPQSLQGPLIWSSQDFPTETDYVYLLSESDKIEVKNALKHFKGLELDGDEVCRENFPLAGLGKRLTQVCHDVYEGRGFAIVRGLDPDEFNVEDLTAVYLGLTSYIAERRGKQDQRGSMLMHVSKPEGTEGEQYILEKPFHTDTVTDCLCLLTRKLAAEGGQSILCSMWTIYNELAATRPDLIHVLAEPNWPFDTFGRDPKYYERALLYYHKDKLIVSFSRRLLVGHLPIYPRTPGIPGLTEAQAEALDAIHFIAKKHEVRTSMKKGDIRFLNNMAILHRREAFTNLGENARHLVRLWANNELMCWKLPRPLRIAWARVFEDGDRKEYWEVEPPTTKDGKILRVAGTCD